MEYLKNGLKSEVVTVNVTDAAKINISEFDWVIIGGSIYMGRINKVLKKFVQENKSELTTKNIALFVCCMTPEDSNKYIQESFNEEVYNIAKYKGNFGGELQQDKMNFFEKTITKMVAKEENKQEKTLYVNMDDLINLISNDDKLK